MIASRPYLERRARKPENVRLAQLVDGRSGAAVPLAYDSRLGALLQWLPLDVRCGLRDLPMFTARQQLDAACASGRLVCRIAPALRRRIATLVARLVKSTPDVACGAVSHGDFNARQLLEHDGELILSDFDEMCIAPPALDLATYCAYLIRGDAEDLDRAQHVLEALVEGYGERPEALDWYLSTMILRRAPRPFRYLDDHWPERVEEMLRAAESACGR